MHEPTVALVIETENLAGGGAARDEVASLERLMKTLASQSCGPARLEEVVVTHRGLDEAGQRRIELAAGRALRFVEVSEAAGYYGSKNAGFDASSAELVIFGDSDCVPEATWLERLTAPFASGAEVVAGRTAYRDDVLGRALTSIDFLYFASPLGEGCTRNFYANNVAFRREVFARFRFPEGKGFYRGECQLLGLALHRAQVAVRFAQDAVTIHRLPDSTREELQLRLLRGADAVSLAPHLARELLPSSVRAAASVPLLAPAAVLGGRYLFSLARLLTTTGGEPAKVLGEIGAMTAASLIDAAGAIARSVGLLSSRTAASTVLSYHSAAGA